MCLLQLGTIQLIQPLVLKGHRHHYGEKRRLQARSTSVSGPSEGVKNLVFLRRLSSPTSRHNVIRNTAPRKVSAEIPQEHALPPKPEPPGKGHAAARSGLSYPAVRTSKIDVDHVPTYKTSGKLITEIDIDEGIVVMLNGDRRTLIHLTTSRSQGP